MPFMMVNMGSNKPKQKFDSFIREPKKELQRVTLVSATQHGRDDQDFYAEVFSQFEANVIALYDIGHLTSVALDAMARLYRGREIPFSEGQLVASDGKAVDQICVEIICGKSDDVWGDFLKIRRNRWGWR